MTTSLQERFEALLERYNDGIEPLESWTTEDLSELEFIVNTELQERYYQEHGIDYEIDPYPPR